MLPQYSIAATPESPPTYLLVAIVHAIVAGLLKGRLQGTGDVFKLLLPSTTRALIL